MKQLHKFILIFVLSISILFATIPVINVRADTTPTPAPTSTSPAPTSSPSTTTSQPSQSSGGQAGSPTPSQSNSSSDQQRQQQIDQAKQDALKQFGPTPTPTNLDQTKQQATQAYIQSLTPTPSINSQHSTPSNSSNANQSSGNNTSPSPTPSNPSTPSNSSNTNAVGSGSTGANTPTTNSGSGSSNSSTNSSGGNGNSNGASVVNAGNGAQSNNNASAASASTNNTNQNNSAVVGNNLQQATVTGGNSSSLNVGNSSVNTGNALSTGTIITGLNTNLQGVSVSEFNINGNQNGDLVLDPQTIAANCISGCANLGGSASNIGNGSGSTNAANVSEKSFDSTFQNNNAAVENTLNLTADSGHNKASLNTGGNSTITTGDANVAANSLTFLNDNVAGNVQYNIVNINGSLNGDIILPQSSVASTGNGNSVSNNGNGANSNNTASSSSSATNTTNQANTANIQNNVTDSATTGDNTASENTKGNAKIKTGNATQDNHVLNIANTNVSGGTWWLVIINKAGQWIGQLVGAPQGATMAGSPGTTFSTDANGNVTASNPSTSSGPSAGSSTQNSNNGAGSNNSANQSQSNNNSTTQNNNAKVVNNLNLKANTGGNHADENTGGNSSVTTGNAHIIANIVNFVNTNVAKGGKLVVTIVNTFGTWLGNFVGPNQQKIASSPSQTTGSTSPSTVSSDRIGSPLSAGSTQPSQGSGGQVSTVAPSPVPTESPEVIAAQDIQVNGDSASSSSSNSHHIIYRYRRHRHYAALNVFANSSQNTSIDNGTAQLAAVDTANGAVEGIQTGDFTTSTAVAGTTAHKKVITINLAWILFIAPAVLLFHFLRKKLSKKSII